MMAENQAASKISAIKKQFNELLDFHTLKQNTSKGSLTKLK
jgi:hypothetical protein